MPSKSGYCTVEVLTGETFQTVEVYFSQENGQIYLKGHSLVSPRFGHRPLKQLNERNLAKIDQAVNERLENAGSDEAMLADFRGSDDSQWSPSNVDDGEGASIRTSAI